MSQHHEFADPPHGQWLFVGDDRQGSKAERDSFEEPSPSPALEPGANPALVTMR